MPERDRDKSVEQWLRQTPVAGAQADACLDAETLAVWAEGRLDGSPRAAAEAHASHCERCQAMLAVMVRTTPAAAASTGSPIRKWLMMLGPPMAAAAAVALWVAVGQDHRAPVLDSLSTQQAKAEVESAPSLVMPTEPSLSREADRSVTSPSSDLAAERRARAEPQTLADAKKEREARQHSATSAVTAARAATEGPEKKDRAAAKRVDAVTGADRLGAAALAPAASLPPPPPPPAAPRPAEVQTAAGNRPAPAAAAPAAPPQQANQTQNQTQNQAQNQAPNQNQVQTTAQSPAVQRQQQALEERQFLAEKPVAGAAKDSAAASRSGGGGGVVGGVADTAAFSSVRMKAGDFEFAAAASAIRWRVVDGRTVQRSSDAGATWSNPHTAPSGVFLTAGSAPSATVCWLVGRAGAIILSSDGVGWHPVAFPVVADLASVIALDARTATVTTVDGRQFATVDDGRTWTRR